MPNPLAAEERYLDLLKAVVSGQLAPVAGMRAWYLLRCLDPSLAAPSPLGRPPTRDGTVVFDASYYVDMAAREAEALERAGHDAGDQLGASRLGVAMTLAPRSRLDAIQACTSAIAAEGLRGDLMDVGAWRGGVAILMRAVVDALSEVSRRVWIADSYDADTEAHPEGGGVLALVPLQEVIEAFRRFGLLDERIEFLVGSFGDTLPVAEIDRLAVLRLDTRGYISTWDALAPMFDLVVDGGFVIVDNYGSIGGCRIATHDVLDEYGHDPEIRVIDRSAVYWRKA